MAFLAASVSGGVRPLGGGGSRETGLRMRRVSLLVGFAVLHTAVTAGLFLYLLAQGFNRVGAVNAAISPMEKLATVLFYVLGTPILWPALRWGGGWMNSLPLSGFMSICLLACLNSVVWAGLLWALQHWIRTRRRKPAHPAA